MTAVRVAVETETHEQAVADLRGCATAIDEAVDAYAKKVAALVSSLQGETVSAYVAAERDWVAEMARLVEALRLLADSAEATAEAIVQHDLAVSRALA